MAHVYWFDIRARLRHAPSGAWNSRYLVAPNGLVSQERFVGGGLMSTGLKAEARDLSFPHSISSYKTRRILDLFLLITFVTAPSNSTVLTQHRIGNQITRESSFTCKQ